MTTTTSTATTITLKGIPERIYSRLKLAADANHRSLNSEAIACLEAMLFPRKAPAAEQLVALRAVRARLPQDAFDHDDVTQLKREGRP